MEAPGLLSRGSCLSGCCIYRLRLSMATGVDKTVNKPESHATTPLHKDMFDIISSRVIDQESYTVYLKDATKV